MPFNRQERELAKTGLRLGRDDVASVGGRRSAWLVITPGSRGAPRRTDATQSRPNPGPNPK